MWEAIKSRTTPAAISRFVSVVLMTGSGAVLGTAAWLEPSALGHSTHTQLGLGQCSFLQLTGYPCPMCGATTTFALMAHLRPLDAMLNQPFAAMLFMMTAAVFAVSAAEVVMPRRRWERLLDWIEPWEGRLAVGFLVFMAVGWLYKIALMAGTA